MVGIICPLVEIGLRWLPKLGVDVHMPTGMPEGGDVCSEASAAVNNENIFF